MRILVVADEVPLAEAIVRGLREEGMSVDVAADGDIALAMGTGNRYDVVLLDRPPTERPDDGVSRRLIARGLLTRVLVLVPSEDAEEVREALATGADDCLPTPFALAELVARVRALGMRPLTGSQSVAFGEIEMDRSARTVTRRGKSVELTRKEFDLLEMMMVRAQGDAVSGEELLDRVWDENADPFTTTVRTTMMTLRRKLGDGPPWDLGASV